MITTPKKVGLTPGKNARHSKSKYQKDNQTIAQKTCKKLRNMRMQHQSKPGQRGKQDLWKTETADRIFLK